MARRRKVAAVSAGALVVAGAVSAALINELHGGWVWWVATSAVVLLWAAATAVMAYRADSPGSRRLGRGAVWSGGKIKGAVTTDTTVSGHVPSPVPAPQLSSDDLAEGAVLAERNIGGPVSTRTNITAREPGPEGAPAPPSADSPAPTGPPTPPASSP